MAEQDRFRGKGWFAASRVIHVYLLVGFQHRLFEPMRWLWLYLTYDRGTRLIAGEFVEVDGPSGPPAADRPTRGCRGRQRR